MVSGSGFVIQGLESKGWGFRVWKLRVQDLGSRV